MDRKNVKVTQRSSFSSPFIVMEVLERAGAMEREGENIIHLEVGEPNFDTPECSKEAAVRTGQLLQVYLDGHS
jgi:aspartate/methionine/tyrosine aminotransferase